MQYCMMWPWDVCYLDELSPPVIHRNLSANNVILTSDMKAKLSDMGVTKILSLIPAQMTQMTQTKAPGTPCYMPPDALMAKQYTSKIDIYSDGVLTIHSLCRRWPFFLRMRFTLIHETPVQSFQFLKLSAGQSVSRRLAITIP